MEKLTVDGQTLAYVKEGSGPRPVIVMHGWGCTSATVASLAAACAHGSTTVYNIDLPGFGASPEPDGAWTVDRYARCIEGLCRELGLKNPILVGHSFGGRVAIVFASRNAVEKLILVDAAGVKPRRPLKYYVKVYTFKAARHLLPYIVGRRRADAVVERMRGRSGSSDYRSASPLMRRVMSLAVNDDLCHLMPSIKAPTLLIWGTADTATPLRDAKKMERLIPDAGLVSYEGAGHYSFLDRPAQTAAVIASFLKLNS